MRCGAMIVDGGPAPNLGRLWTSLLFGLRHISPDRRFLAWAAYATVPGGLLGWMAIYSSNLLAPVVAHALIVARSTTSASSGSAPAGRRSSPLRARCSEQDPAERPCPGARRWAQSLCGGGSNGRFAAAADFQRGTLDVRPHRSLRSAPDNNALSSIYEGLVAMHHRGQDATAITTFSDVQARHGAGAGRLQREEHRTPLRAQPAWATCATRPSVKGEVEDIQPFIIHFPLGVAVAHNRNATYFIEL